MQSSNSRTRSRGKRASLAAIVLVALLSLPVGTSWGAPGDTIRVSVASDGTQGNKASTDPAISADGRFVAFSSRSNLVPETDEGFWQSCRNEFADGPGFYFCFDIFVHDRQTGATVAITEFVSFNSFRPSLSGDGRFVAFESLERFGVSGDNDLWDIFVYDRQSNTMTLASISSTGSQANLHSFDAAISADGRFITFWSRASNLVPSDTNDCGFGVSGTCPDVFVHDRLAGTTRRVSISSSGAQANNLSVAPAISADGRFVAFASDASNLVPGDTNGGSDVFVHHLETGATERVSVASVGSQANGRSDAPAISGDGRFVAFSSNATNLVSGDTNGTQDIFLHDRQTGETNRVNVSSGGTQSNGGGGSPSVSADGRFVAFEDAGSNLVPNDTNNRVDIFVHDRETGKTERVSIASSGSEGNHNSRAPALNGDGHVVAFMSNASNLVPGDTNTCKDLSFDPEPCLDIFVHELDVVPTDAVAPACAIIGTGTDAQGRKVIDVKTQDTGSGLAAITVLKKVNSQITIPTFTAGTTSPVTVRATKLDQTKPSQVQLRVTDVAGNATVCDPVDVLVVKEATRPSELTLTGIPGEEDTLTLTNGTPGVTKLEVTVNGVRVKLQHLGDGEVRELDLTVAMQPGEDNTVTIRAWGKAGTSVYLLLWDGGQ